VDGSRKKKGVFLADFHGTYGIGNARLTYEERFSLFLNIDRVDSRRAFITNAAFLAGLKDSIPKQFWKGISSTDDEAEYLADQFQDRQRFYANGRGRT
jgi:hypothetical protein